MNPQSDQGDETVALVYRGSEPHPAHRGFVESIGGTTVGLNKLDTYGFHTSIPGEVLNGVLLDEFDVIIAEGTRVLYGLFANQFIRNSKLIYLGCDQALYKLGQESYTIEDGFNRLIKNHGVPFIKKLFRLHVDGAIVISEFAAGYIIEFLSPRTPVRIARPYIQPEVYAELGTVEPKLDAKVAVTVGGNGRYKGVDMLVDAWDLVRDYHPAAELKVVGSGHPKQYEDTTGVEVKGYVESLSTVHETASLYVQPSRVDGFAITVVEAMRAGLPPVVTATTGSKTEVARLDSSLVTNPERKSLAKAVNAYFDRPSRYKERISRQCRTIGNSYSEEYRTKLFQIGYNDLIAEIEGKND